MERRQGSPSRGRRSTSPNRSAYTTPSNVPAVVPHSSDPSWGVGGVPMPNAQLYHQRPATGEQKPTSQLSLPQIHEHAAASPRSFHRCPRFARAFCCDGLHSHQTRTCAAIAPADFVILAGEHCVPTGQLGGPSSTVQVQKGVRAWASVKTRKTLRGPSSRQH